MRKQLTPDQIETCPRSTPWGPTQHQEQIAPGIWQVSTAGHGGIYIASWRLASMPACLSAGTPYSPQGWFEEDCDWALACAAFPSEFDLRSCHYALKTIGSKGGSAGTGKAKARTSVQARKAAMVRWDKTKASKTTKPNTP